MLKVEYEFRRGFFFVRLFGNIEKDNYNIFVKEIDNIVTNVGINKMVINVDKVNNIDNNCIRKLYKYIKNNIYKGILTIICDNNVLLQNELLPKIKLEKEVYNYI